jgi:D-alanyl-lipoteichoic acid acyltransferase DltB (MBOAT superfamily)
VLFNSPIFLFGFLPVAFSLFFLLAKQSHFAARIWLILSSLFFYAWWNPPYVLLLLASATFNYFVGQRLQNRPAHKQKSKQRLLFLGLTFNILLLGYFKYLGFLLAVIFGYPIQRPEGNSVVLPLAISFYTFQKIAYLVDSYLGRIKEKSFSNYLLFVSFFPQLIAGPIVHYSEVFPQFRDPKTYRLDLANVTEGLTILLLGLAKKVILADEFARHADAGFNSVSNGLDISLFAAWATTLSYTLQIYFDFSGYSDMAIGLARMFNVRLPLNFDAPYQAANIIEFWRRWHMTLSRFLRDYVYIPLGGNRRGLLRRHANLLLTMIIGGLWHGAAWTFVLWGALHGLYLLINHMWRSIVGHDGHGRGYAIFARALTLLAVIVAWVLFRAIDLSSALRLYEGMLGWNGAILPEQILSIMPALRNTFTGIGNIPGLADTSVMGTLELTVMLALGIGIALYSPTLYSMSQRTRLVLVGFSFAFVIQKIFFGNAASPFLYFQF